MVFAFTSKFYDPSPRHHRDDQGTPPHSLIARNRINAAVVFVVVMSYLVYVIHALFVLAIPLTIFVPVLIMPFIFVPLVVTNAPVAALNMLTAQLTKLAAMLNGESGTGSHTINNVNEQEKQSVRKLMLGLKLNITQVRRAGRRRRR